MARYIDADRIVFWIRHISSNGKLCDTDVRKVAFSDEIARIPTADVVPKSEVAREIFGEIANIMVLQHGFNEKHIVAHIDFELLKELKKKYTEGENNG